MIRNRIKITGNGCVEIVKSGLSDSHMIFEKNKKNSTYYRTPYGQMLLDVNTRELEIQVTEDEIDVRIEYELDVNHDSDPITGRQQCGNFTAYYSSDPDGNLFYSKNPVSPDPAFP